MTGPPAIPGIGLSMRADRRGLPGDVELAFGEPESLPACGLSAELLHVLMLPDFERADRIGEFWGYPESRVFAELLIDGEEDRILRAVLVGMLREAE